MRFAIAILLAACSSTPKEPTITKEQQQTMCRPSALHLVDLITTGETGSVPYAAKLRTALMDHCTLDKWGQDAMTCFEQLKEINNADTCAKYLTVPQRDGFQQAIEGTAP